MEKGSDPTIVTVVNHHQCPCFLLGKIRHKNKNDDITQHPCDYDLLFLLAVDTYGGEATEHGGRTMNDGRTLYRVFKKEEEEEQREETNCYPCVTIRD